LQNYGTFRYESNPNSDYEQETIRQGSHNFENNHAMITQSLFGIFKEVLIFSPIGHMLTYRQR